MKLGTKVRSTMDGQKGLIVDTTEFGLAVRLDRGSVEMIVPFRGKDWVEDVQPPLQPGQMARVLYEADRALRVALGEYGVPEFVNLRDAEKIGWMGKDPPTGLSRDRSRLYRAVRGSLEGSK